MNSRAQVTTALIITALTASGCATSLGSKDNILPADLPSMEEIYDAHTQHKPIPKRKGPEAAKTDPGAKSDSSEQMMDSTHLNPWEEKSTTASLARKKQAAPMVKAVKTEAPVPVQSVIEEPAAVTAKPGTLTRAVQTGDIDLVGYTRDAANEIDNTFRLLPNPTLVMFVYPHLSGAEGTPVPGYTTKFSMYEKSEFALPGEVASQP